MGPAVKAAGAKPAEVQSIVRDNAALQDALQGIPDNQEVKVHSAVRGLMVQYGDSVARKAVVAIADHYESLLVKPSQTLQSHIANEARALIAETDSIARIAVRLDPKSNNRAATAAIIAKFDLQVAKVTEFADKMTVYDNCIEDQGAAIGQLMSDINLPENSNDAYSERIKGKQQKRNLVLDEKKFEETRLMEYFDGGASKNCGGIKYTLKELVMPGNMGKNDGRGVELIKAATSYFKGRAPWYYTVLPYVNRILAESLIGNFFRPPTKADGFTGCPSEYVVRYTTHAKELFDYLNAIVPKEIMQTIRKPFKYGPDELTAQCELEDGPTALFCILAKYRPSSERYRDETRNKIVALAGKFNDGSNPSSRINDNTWLLQEAIDLDIKIPWNTTGKMLVTMFSERSVTFYDELKKFSDVGAIVDKDDAAVELKALFDAVSEACRTLLDSGHEMKHIMNIGKYQPNPGKGDQTQTGDTGDQSNLCSFGAECTRFPCSFGHNKADNALKIKKKAERKASKGSPGSKKDGGKGKGKGKCQAVKCTAPTPKNYKLCTKCHRSAVESKQNVKLKDGTEFEIKETVKSQQTARIAQLEKKLKQQEEESDIEVEEEPDSNGKRKSANMAKCSGAKGDGAGKSSVLERLGLGMPSKQFRFANAICHMQNSQEAEDELAAMHAEAECAYAMQIDSGAGVNVELNATADRSGSLIPDFYESGTDSDDDSN